MTRTELQSTIAPLRNVGLFSELVNRLVSRAPGLPGMACFTGFSGFGKTTAAIYAANKHRAYHVQVKSVWTRKKLCSAILTELGLDIPTTIADMVDAIGRELAVSRRPLIVDEADFLLKESFIEVVRDIYESSQGTIILIGEEMLPHKLKRWEKVHGRMLDWVQAQPAALQDARHLAKLYCKGLDIADELMAAVCDASAGSVRRIIVNLDRVREQALTANVAKIGRGQFTGDFFTGNPPLRRAA
jgi:DNA transposition AAA+ family ATPase